MSHICGIVLYMRMWPHHMNFISCVNKWPAIKLLNYFTAKKCLLLLMMSLLNIGLLSNCSCITMISQLFFSPDFQGSILFHHFFCKIIKKHTFAVMFKPFIFSVVPSCSHSLFGGLICAHENRDHQSAASLRLLQLWTSLTSPLGRNKVLYRTVRANNRYSSLPQT